MTLNRRISKLLSGTTNANVLPNSSLAGPLGGVNSIDSSGILPSSGNSVGDMKLTTDKKSLHIWDGGEWDRILAGADGAPHWDSGGVFLTRPTYSAAQSFTQGDSGGARLDNRITLTPTAVDPDGFAITYGVDLAPASPNQLDSATVTGNNIVFTPKYGLLADSQNNEGTFHARIRASDGVRIITDTVAFTLEYKEELHQPAGTTRLLGLRFNGGAIDKVGSWNTPAVTGSPTYNASGGTRGSGYISGFSSGVYLAPGELSSANDGRNKTFIAWYKGTQTSAGTNSVYSPGVPIFGHTSGAVHMGFGLEDGKIVACGGSAATKGTTTVTDGNWNMLAWTWTTGDVVEGYVNASGTMTKEISNKDVSSSSSYNTIDKIGTGYGYGGMDYPTALDAIQIYTGILTQAQLQAIYAKGSG